MLEREVLKYRPDLVVWQFHDNDGQHALYSAALGNFYHRPTSYLANHTANKAYHFFCRQKIRLSSMDPQTGDQGNLICRWDGVQADFEGVVATLEPLAIRLFVFLYPSWPEGDNWENYGDAGLELHRKLVESLEARDIPVVDILPMFVELDPATYRVEPGDPWHCNAAGHEIIAETIFEPVRDLLFSSEGHGAMR